MKYTHTTFPNIDSYIVVENTRDLQNNYITFRVNDVRYRRELTTVFFKVTKTEKNDFYHNMINVHSEMFNLSTNELLYDNRDFTLGICEGITWEYLSEVDISNINIIDYDSLITI